MRWVKARPNEYLVIGRRGKVTNCGTAVSVFLWPGSSYVLVPSTKQEAAFAMTQESKDGVPLRFKGYVIYRVTDPIAASRLFDFMSGHGHDEIKALISVVCLGELRALVSHLTMDECIKQRKTVLTESISNALERTTHGDGAEKDMPTQRWGIELDVVQVAQVFIVDDQLRRQLEAEVRNKIKATSDLSDIRTREEVKLAGVLSDRKLQKQSLETERERIRIAREKFQLEKAAERERIETEAPIRLLEIQKRRETLEQERDMRRLENEVRELEVCRDIMLEKARQVLRKEILPIEHAPQIAESVSGFFKGANISFYGEAAPLMSTLGPVVDMITGTLRNARGGPENVEENA